MKLGLALSGGGARGIAHLGMMQVMEEVGLKPDLLAGTSAGAIGAALYAHGYSPQEIMEIIRDTRLMNIIRPAWTIRGLLGFDKVGEKLKEYLPEDDFGALKIPLTVAATQIRTGEVRYFSQGPLIRAILASSCIPVVFSPIVIDGEDYMDGGVSDNLPASVLREEADVVIGMHCNPIERNFKSRSAKDMIERSLLLAISNATYAQSGICDLFLDPPALAAYKVFDFGKAEEIFKIGEDYARENIAKFEAIAKQ